MIIEVLSFRLAKLSVTTGYIFYRCSENGFLIVAHLVVYFDEGVEKYLCS